MCWGHFTRSRPRFPGEVQNFCNIKLNFTVSGDNLENSVKGIEFVFCWIGTAIFPEEAMYCLGCNEEDYKKLVTYGCLEASINVGFYLGRGELKLHNFFDLLFVCLSNGSGANFRTARHNEQTHHFLKEILFCYDFNDGEDIPNWMSFVMCILEEFGLRHHRPEIEELVARATAVLAVSPRTKTIES